MKLDHITAIVANADVAADALRCLLAAEPVATLTLAGMAIRSFRIGDAEIHLNAPAGPGPVDDHYRRHGPGLHHIALCVDHLDTVLAELHRRGLRTRGAPVETAPGLREVFLDPATAGGLLVQLVERRGANADSYDLDSAAVGRLLEQSPESNRSSTRPRQ